MRPATNSKVCLIVSVHSNTVASSLSSKKFGGSTYRYTRLIGCCQNSWDLVELGQLSYSAIKGDMNRKHYFVAYSFLSSLLHDGCIQ